MEHINESDHVDPLTDNLVICYFFNVLVTLIYMLQLVKFIINVLYILRIIIQSFLCTSLFHFKMGQKQVVYGPTWPIYLHKKSGLTQIVNGRTMARLRPLCKRVTRLNLVHYLSLIKTKVLNALDSIYDFTFPVVLQL